MSTKPDAAGFTIIPFKHGPFWNFSYLLICGETREAAVIDPAWEVEAIIAGAAKYRARIGTVILTHGHSDHAHGTGDIVRAMGARVVIHEAELPELLRTYDGHVDTVNEDGTLSVGRVPLDLLLTPGHSPGSLSVLAGGNLFTGDALHVGALGRIGTEVGAVVGAWTTVDTVLRTLPGDTIIRPGHDAGPTPFSTLGEERGRLPALAATTFAQFVREVGRAGRR